VIIIAGMFPIFVGAVEHWHRIATIVRRLYFSLPSNGFQSVGVTARENSNHFERTTYISTNPCNGNFGNKNKLPVMVTMEKTKNGNYRIFPKQN